MIKCLQPQVIIAAVLLSSGWVYADQAIPEPFPVLMPSHVPTQVAPVITTTVAATDPASKAQDNLLKILSINNSNTSVSQKKIPVHSDPFFYFQQGSLHQNLQSFADRFHYQLIWHVVDPNNGELADYNLVGNDNVSAKTPAEILKTELHPYPVEVKIWEANKVLCVTSDNSCVE